MLCGVWNGPPLLDTDTFIVSFPAKPHQNLKHWSNPGDPPEQSHVPPHPTPLASDQSNEFYHLQDILEDKLCREGIKYSKFKPHKPKNPVIDRSNLLDINFIPLSGRIGD